MNVRDLARLLGLDPVVGAADGKADREAVGVLQGNARVNILELRPDFHHAVGRHLGRECIVIEIVVVPVLQGGEKLRVLGKDAAADVEHRANVVLGHIQRDGGVGEVRVGDHRDVGLGVVRRDVLDAAEIEVARDIRAGRLAEGHGVAQEYHGGLSVRGVPHFATHGRVIVRGSVGAVLLQELHGLGGHQLGIEGPEDRLDGVDPHPVAVVAVVAVEEGHVPDRLVAGIVPRGAGLLCKRLGGIEVYGLFSEGPVALIGVEEGFTLIHTEHSAVGRLAVRVFVRSLYVAEGCHREPCVVIVVGTCGAPLHPDAAVPVGICIVGQAVNDAHICIDIITGIDPVHLPFFLGAVVLVMSGNGRCVIGCLVIIISPHPRLVAVITRAA